MEIYLRDKFIINITKLQLTILPIMSGLFMINITKEKDWVGFGTQFSHGRQHRHNTDVTGKENLCFAQL